MNSTPEELLTDYFNKIYFYTEKMQKETDIRKVNEYVDRFVETYFSLKFGVFDIKKIPSSAKIDNIDFYMYAGIDALRKYKKFIEWKKLVEFLPVNKNVSDKEYVKFLKENKNRIKKLDYFSKNIFLEKTRNIPLKTLKDFIKKGIVTLDEICSVNTVLFNSDLIKEYPEILQNENYLLKIFKNQNISRFPDVFTYKFIKSKKNILKRFFEYDIYTAGMSFFKKTGYLNQKQTEEILKEFVIDNPKYDDTDKSAIIRVAVNVSENFIAENINYLDLKYLLKHKEFSMDFIEPFKDLIFQESEIADVVFQKTKDRRIVDFMVKNYNKGVMKGLYELFIQKSPLIDEKILFLNKKHPFLPSGEKLFFYFIHNENVSVEKKKDVYFNYGIYKNLTNETKSEHNYILSKALNNEDIKNIDILYKISYPFEYFKEYYDLKNIKEKLMFKRIQKEILNPENWKNFIDKHKNGGSKIFLSRITDTVTRLSSVFEIKSEDIIKVISNITGVKEKENENEIERN